MYLCQQYEFFSEEGKQKLAEYGKNYSRMQEKIDWLMFLLDKNIKLFLDISILGKHKYFKDHCFKVNIKSFLIFSWSVLEFLFSENIEIF